MNTDQRIVKEKDKKIVIKDHQCLLKARGLFQMTLKSLIFLALSDKRVVILP